MGKLSKVYEKLQVKCGRGQAGRERAGSAAGDGISRGDFYFRFRKASLRAWMSIAELTARIRAFRDARDWLQFHSPKDLSVAIIAEAGELLQHFVWKSPEESWQRAEAKKPEIADEIADVGILLFELADNLGLDLAAEMNAKLARNEVRYPAEKARGSNAKYNEL